MDLFRFIKRERGEKEIIISVWGTLLSSFFTPGVQV